ncbi:hypothetical protein [Massilia sp. CFBP 13647]|nr:hypothetical protein [Massilia sp. CFBP 13647]
MLRSDQGAPLIGALEVVAAIGPAAHAALPLLMAHVRQPPAALNGLYRELYDAVGALGPAARPAIPLLLDRTRDPDHSVQALRILGKLGKYDSRRVVPHLSATLIDSTGDLWVLPALAAIGKDARGALPAVLGALEQAKVRRDGRQAAAALDALVAIGTPGESVPVLIGLLGDPVLDAPAVDAFGALGSAGTRAVPLLIDKLQRSRGDEGKAVGIVRALAAIAPASPPVQRQLLLEATRHGSAHAAYALARIGPLPADFAAPLAAALAKKPATPTCAWRSRMCGSRTSLRR